MPPQNKQSRKTILLTGASGVFGQALLRVLMVDHDVICLVRNTPVLADCETVQGDITQPLLGIERTRFLELSKRVDWIIHSAAMTRLDGDSELIRKINCDGTSNVTDVAKVLDVPLYYISTAFAADCEYHAGVREATPYEDAKREAERRVLDSGASVAIFRPSIVIGDTDTGAISAYQGFQTTLGLILAGALSVVPCPETARVDFIARDTAAQAVAEALRNDVRSGTYDLTSGAAAITVADLVVVLADVAAANELPFKRPKPIDPDIFDRLFRPAFWDAVPDAMRGMLERSLTLCRYVSLKTPLQSSLPQLLPTLKYDAQTARTHMFNSMNFMCANAAPLRRLLRTQQRKKVMSPPDLRTVQQLDAMSERV